MRALWRPVAVAGPAFTVAGDPADNLALHRASAEAPPGAVVVAATGPSREVAIWGSLLSSICREKGVLGFVTDGVVRDSDRIRELGFPVFCGGVALFGPQKERPGTLQAEIELEGVAVAPGDWIVADGDGVVVVPAGELDAALEAAEAIERREAQMIARARAGESTIAQLGLE